tara:strand:- start:62 stop:2230 length:2169 start_codon:yes stop_codon:yes gene_type:complete
VAEPFTIGNLLKDLRAEEDIYNLPTSKQIYDDPNDLTSGIPKEEVKVETDTVIDKDDGITGVASTDVLEMYPELKGKLYKSNADVRLDILANASQEKNNLLAAAQVESDPAKLEAAKKNVQDDLDAFMEKYKANPSRDLEAIKSFYDESEKELDALYKEDDMSFEKKLALAQFGLELAGGRSWNGRALPILSEAGQNLIKNLGAINAQKKANAKDKRVAKATLKREEGKTLLEAAQNNAAEAATLEWDVMKTGFTIASDYDDMMNTNAANDRKVYSEQLASQIQGNFEIFEKYVGEKYPDADTGVTQFISKRTGQVTMPRVGVRKSNGEVFVFADPNIHPNLVDENGQPVLVNADLYADMSVDGGGITFSSGGMMPGAEGLKGGVKDLNKFFETQDTLNQTAAVLNGLGIMRQDIYDDGTRVGWAGGARSVFQNTWRNAQTVWQMITGDASKSASKNPNSAEYWNGGQERYYITDLLGGPEGSEANKFATLESQDENGNPIITSILSDAQKKGLQAAVNQGTIMMTNDYDSYIAAKAAGEKFVVLGDGDSVSVEDLDSVFTKDFYDPAIDKMQVRAQSLIYALARSRKASGRLNKDDIERASLTLNLYGKSDRGIDASLEVVQVELQTYLRDEISKLRQGYFNEKDRSGRDPFVGWAKDWIDRGNYMPSYFEPWVNEYLPESYQNRTRYRTFDDTSIMTSSSFEEYDSGMGISGSVITEEGG